MASHAAKKMFFMFIPAFPRPPTAEGKNLRHPNKAVKFRLTALLFYFTSTSSAESSGFSSGFSSAFSVSAEGS